MPLFEWKVDQHGDIYDDVIGFDLGSFRFGKKPGDPFFAGVLDSVLEEMAQSTLSEAKRFWPVDTGRSRLGLFNQKIGQAIHWGNKYAYAFWVERRWFPLRYLFTEAKIRRYVNIALGRLGLSHIRVPPGAFKEG